MAPGKRISVGDLLFSFECYNNFVSCMKNLSSVLLSNLIGLFILAACSSSGEAVTPVPVTASAQPTATEVKILPTPASPGDSSTWQNLQATMAQVEISEDFVTEYGTTRIPSAGMKFMWVHVQLKNVGQAEVDMPTLENFSVLYAATELKPTYGHRQGYKDYSTLEPALVPDHEADAWLRFDIPAEAELTDLRFVFLPTSSQVGASFSSPNYPYSDKPTYVWQCAP